jgi:hypothetical protein
MEKTINMDSKVKREVGSDTSFFPIEGMVKIIVNGTLKAYRAWYYISILALLTDVYRGFLSHSRLVLNCYNDNKQILLNII